MSKDSNSKKSHNNNYVTIEPRSIKRKDFLLIDGKEVEVQRIQSKAIAEYNANNGITVYVQSDSEDSYLGAIPIKDYIKPSRESKARQAVANKIDALASKDFTAEQLALIKQQLGL